MPASLKKGDQGKDVQTLQILLMERGFPVDIDDNFGTQTLRAVRAFQSQNLDQHGQPLVVDGKVGPLTWWSLTHPKPGDIVVWWRVSLQGWQGHIGLVHSLKDGILYTIEGNRSPQVQGFSYIMSRMDKLLGFGHVPDKENKRQRDQIN